MISILKCRGGVYFSIASSWLYVYMYSVRLYMVSYLPLHQGISHVDSKRKYSHLSAPSMRESNLSGKREVERQHCWYQGAIYPSDSDKLDIILNIFIIGRRNWMQIWRYHVITGHTASSCHQVIITYRQKVISL